MTTATIESLAYIATVDVEETTPLGETHTVTTPIDSLIATFNVDVGDSLDHTVQFKPEAIANRIAGYALTDELAAVEALVREVVFGWSPSLQPADPANPVDVNGGTDDRIAVAWADGASDAAAAVLAPFADRIAAAGAAVAS